MNYLNTPKGDWESYVDKKLGNNCNRIREKYNIKIGGEVEDKDFCSGCINKKIEIKDIGIKANMMNMFMFWLIKKGGVLHDNN